MPGTVYTLKAALDRSRLDRALKEFESAVKREIDKRLAREIREQLLYSAVPWLSRKAFERLARWCKTDGIYADGMMVAREIRLVLFGRIIDRREVGV